MKKKGFCIFLCFCMILSTTALSFADTAGVSVSLDGRKIAFTNSTGSPFIDQNNRTLVPLRVTMENCGCQVDWNNDTRTAIVKKSGTTVTAQIGQSYININGTKKAIDTASVIKNGRTYLPIRAVLEAFGYSLGYDASTKTVKVLSFTSETGTIPLRVSFINVGQGDCELIDFGAYEILIDGGEYSVASSVISYIRPYIDGNIELYIATHPDSDHIGAAPAILYAFNVDTIIDSGFQKDTATYRNYVQYASSSSVLYDDDLTFDMGNGAKLNIIETGDGFSSCNSNSVVAMITYGNNRILFTGDMESDAESFALNKFCDVSVLKVGHHGSKSASSQAFLNIVKPEYAVISCAKSNSYKHPHSETITRLTNSGAKVLSTSKSGTLTLTANKKDFYWNTVQPLSLADAGNYNAPQNATTPTKPSTVTQNTNTADQANAKYVGNSSTKKYHRLNCRYVSKISSSNIVYFSAKPSGYTPCKVCNP